MKYAIYRKNDNFFATWRIKATLLSPEESGSQGGRGHSTVNLTNT